jgi:hypothetical protein
MASLGDIKIEIGVTIPIETVDRCCQILSMYLTDNPDKALDVSGWNNDGKIYRAVMVIKRSDKE